jgi:hypothetical protein
MEGNISLPPVYFAMLPSHSIFSFSWFFLFTPPPTTVAVAVAVAAAAAAMTTNTAATAATAAPHLMSQLILIFPIFLACFSHHFYA